jgi:hypothetical protein
LLLQVKDKPEVQEKLQRRIASTEVKMLNPPRPGALQPHLTPSALPLQLWCQHDFMQP